VMIAGELNPNLTEPSAGAGGSILIDSNLVSDNLANDDGGGLRFLQAGDGEVDVRNNVVSDNISAHEGGGIALDDSTNVHITGNTVAKNLTTATAITSNGQPAPAGLSTASNSDQLQARLRATNSARRTVLYSSPQEFRDNIFFQNLAGTWDPGSGTVKGIDPASPAGNPKRVWEMGSVDGGVTLAPTYSVLSQYDAGVSASVTNKVNAGTNYPSFVTPYDVGVQIITSRAFPSFREAAIVADAVAPNVQGDYHLSGTGSPAYQAGPASADAAILGHDIDGRSRANPVDIGADALPNP
jgi:parallel beta-helix repeat protein